MFRKNVIEQPLIMKFMVFDFDVYLFKLTCYKTKNEANNLPKKRKKEKEDAVSTYLSRLYIRKNIY